MRHAMRLSFLFLLTAMFWACNQQPTAFEEPGAAPQGTIEADRFGNRNAVFDQMAEFELTIENLTPATAPGASQPFAPPLFATHMPLFHVFKVGTFASDELAQIAEDAVSGPLTEQLNGSDRVYAVAQAGGVILPGASATVTIQAKPGYHRLSMVSMLVNTNDAFTGIDALRLPRSGSKMYYLRAYDAGTEQNTEMAAHIPGPCCGSPLVRVPSEEPIHYHKGIRGGGDLDPQVFGWEEPVARLTIRRIN